MITRLNSVLHRMSVDSAIKRYTEGNKVLAEGEGVLCVLEDYLVNLGYDFEDEEVQEWRKSVSYPEYEVSSLGLVRNAKSKRVLSPCLKCKYEDGVKAVWRTRLLLTKNGKQHSTKPHRLVAEAFLGEIPENYMVSHKNDIPIDNRAVNLEYVPAKVNVSIKWLLNDLNSFLLTQPYIDYVYEVTKEVVDYAVGDVGEGLELELTQKDIAEVKLYVDASSPTIKAIYDFKEKGEGLLTRLALDDEGRFYLPDSALEVN